MSDRNRRHSLHTNSSNYVITTLRDKIKGIESQKGEKLDLLDPTRNGAIVHHEQILINKRARNVRKVYMNDHRYKIGWVVDWDLNHCMVCSAQFGWILGRPKHHCRACGALVCHGCSPYVTQVPSLNEFGGSRVCINCFGLKPGMFSPAPDVPKLNQDADAYSICSNSPLPSPGNSFSQTKRHSASFMSSITDDTTPVGSVRRPKSSRNRHSGMGVGGGVGTPVVVMGDLAQAEASLAQQIEQFEREQLPLYQEDYLKMREFVPLDIYKTSVDRMIEQGLTPAVAARVWTNKALWLICTHKDDIAKIHLADFRGKYSPEGLDVRELRAIWYNLPVWDEHSANPLEVGKAEWRSGFKSKLDNQVYKMHAGNLAEQFKRHPDYEECELYHVYDPTIPLRTRYERSASLHQHAISSPHDVNLHDTHLRVQALPHKVARGTVRDKTRAYLSNYDEDGLPIVREAGDQEDEVEYEPMWAEEEDEYQPNWAEETEEDVYAYEEEEDSGLLGRGIDHSKPPSGVAVRSKASSKHNSPVRESKHQGLVQDFNAEHDAEFSDLDNDLEDDATEPYPLMGQPGPGSAGSSTRSPQRVPFGGVAAQGVSPINVPTRMTRGLSGQSLRSTSDHSSAAAGSQAQSSDTRSHGSFHYRSPALAGTPTSQSVHAQQLLDYRHNRDPATHSPVPGSFPKEIVSPNRRPVSNLSPKGSGRYSTGSPMGVHSAAPSRPLSLNTANMTSSFAGGLSPTPSQGGKTSPFPVNVSPIPAYTYNQPTSFVPKRDGNPVAAKPARHSTGSSVFFGEQSLVHPNQPEGAYDSSNPHGYSARRLERDQARRMRSAEVRAQTEGIDHSDSGVGLGDEDYEHVSPTSSISSHNDDTVSTPARQPDSNGTASGDADDRAMTYSPFGGALGVRDGANVTSSEASTDRGSVKRSHQSAQAAPSTPPPVQYVPAVVDEDVVEEGEEGEEYLEDDESYMSEDDDLSFNTAEEIKTPMLNRHGHRTGTKKRPTRTPYTVRRAVAASKGVPAVVEAVQEEPAGVPAESLDLSFMRDNMVKYLELGDAQSATSLLSMAKHATPRIPVDSLIDSSRAAELMMLLFRNPNRLQSPEATLKLLVDTLRANVNLLEASTGKGLLHYMVENDRQSLGKLLIVRGADIFLEDLDGACPLAVNLGRKQDWVVEEYQRSGRQDQLLVSPNAELKLRYATHLIFAGYSQHAGVVIRQGNLQITPEQASHLLSSCRGNFENMKDPIETFELLESLGAAYEDG